MRRMNLLNLLATVVWSLQLPPQPLGSGLQCHRPQSYWKGLTHSIRAFVMQFDARGEDDCGTQHFRGSLYGVTATVSLHMKSRQAEVQLRGLPIGGSLTGIGRLKDLNGEEGEVELEEGFAAQLAWRMVSIQSAALDRVANTVTVTVTVPLFGAQSLELQRVSAV